MRTGRIAWAVLVAGAATVADAAAQCAMCGLSADAADPSAGNRTLARAILVLLLPALGLFCGAGVLLWKFRGPHGGRAPWGWARRRAGVAPGSATDGARQGEREPAPPVGVPGVELQARQP